jgi:hypothetical protein
MKGPKETGSVILHVFLERLEVITFYRSQQLPGSCDRLRSIPVSKPILGRKVLLSSV